MTQRADIAIVGAGILGLATALRLLEAKPDLRIVVLDKEPVSRCTRPGTTAAWCMPACTTSPASRLACAGGQDGPSKRFCEEHAIPIERTGKLVVALDASELWSGSRRSRSGPSPMASRGSRRSARSASADEPHAAGIRALWSPGTGIVDFRRVAAAYADEVRARGGTIEVGRR